MIKQLIMKTKIILIQMVLILFFKVSAIGQTAAVTNFSAHGVNLSPEIAGKLTRIELVKLEKYAVLDKFDMESELQGNAEFEDCYGKSCLIKMGQALKVDFMVSGSIDALGNKIIITVKIIDVKGEQIHDTKSMEFDDQPAEISRMMEIVLREMHDMPINEETKKSLSFKNEVITSTNVGRVSNSGPRFGVSYAAVGKDLSDFLTRSEREGGLGSLPVMSNLGYQFEVQYIGTENFSALFEVIPNIAGMEQGHFIPTISLMNGFRFGQSGWEFAFGPNFGARREIKGFNHDGEFYTENEWKDRAYEEWQNDASNFDQTTGAIVNPYQDPTDEYTTRLDTRGDLEFNTNWIMGVGRTFRSGALNIPVNMYYSGNQYGGMIGASVGFNIVKKKESINQKIR
jgi:hypothetical protein